YQESVRRMFSESQNRSVTRQVKDAQILADVTVQNLSDVAFTITDIELSVLQQSRQSGTSLVPVASLRLQGANDPTSQPEFNLGPYDPERGPFIFETTGIYPNLVEDLLHEPQGLVYRVVNYNVVDEFGRNFAYTSQEVNDRTAQITIDFGDGTVESYHVATHGEYDDQGRVKSLTMQRALEIIGLTPSTAASGDVPEADPSDQDILSSYGTQRDPADNVEVLTRIRGVQADLGSADPEKRFWAVISANRQVPKTMDFSEMELRARDNILLVFTRDIDEDGLLDREELFYGSSDEQVDTDGDGISDFDEVRTGWSVAVKGTGITRVFSSPASADTDGDGLADDVEMQFATDPTREDTDFDGLSDRLEIQGPIEVVLFDGDEDETNNPLLVLPRYDGPAAIANGFKSADEPEPGICDTVAVGDDVQIVPFGELAEPGQVLITAGDNGVLDTQPNFDADGLPVEGDDYVRVAHDRDYLLDPLSPDTDHDGIPDGRELYVGINPNRADAARIVDSDQDGLTDEEESKGWWIEVATVAAGDSPTSGTPQIQRVHVTSDPFRADTDRDKLPDVYERAIGTDPRSRDTDEDYLLDYYEFDPADASGLYADRVLALADAADRCSDAPFCAYTAPQASLTGTDPRQADTDGDDLTDYFEVKEFGSNPVELDTDGDELPDGAEWNHGTDPNQQDTDGDSVNDRRELTIGTDPLVKDKLVRFEFDKLRVNEADDTGVLGDAIELRYSLKWKLPHSDWQQWYYGADDLDTGWEKTIDEPAKNVILTEGDVFTIQIEATENDPGATVDDEFETWTRTFGYADATTEAIIAKQKGDGWIWTYINVTVITS
ncbi:MAG: hypothetical protein JJ992_18500, partial [Planctomycetes bacterium]|nr:hypothetical protein [Planctomycetota bacterium]